MRSAEKLLRKSILDFISDDAKTVAESSGTNDRRKLDEYLTGVREVERRIERTDDEPRSRSTLTIRFPRELPTIMANTFG